MLSLLLFSAFLSRIFWGHLSDRIGGLRTVLLGTTCQAVGMAFFGFVDDFVGLYVLSAAFGLGFGGIKIGRAHVCTPVTHAHLVCRLLLEPTKHSTTHCSPRLPT